MAGVVTGCSGPATTVQPASRPASPDGTWSPDGQRHPGHIRIEDRDGVRTVRAADVPQTIAWVQVAGRWRAVARVVWSGDDRQACVTSYGEDGAFLETTLLVTDP